MIPSSHDVLAFIADSNRLITVEENQVEQVSESIIQMDQTEVCLFNQNPCAYGLDDLIRVKCFPYLLRKFKRAQLQDYLKMTGNNQPIECAGGYFQDPENDHLLGHIDIIEYMSGKRKACPIASSEASFIWHSDFRNFVLCNRCGKRLEGKPECNLASIYINYKVVVKDHK